MKIIYTDSALNELERFQNQRKSELEAFLENKKYIFGDEVVEITASDIREADKYFKVIEVSKNKLPLTNMLLKVYMFTGIAMVIIGLFYPDIRQLIDRSPMQISLVLGGLVLSFVSFFGSYYFKIREDRRADIEKRYKEYEKTNKFEIKNTAN